MLQGDQTKTEIKARYALGYVPARHSTVLRAL